MLNNVFKPYCAQCFYMHYGGTLQLYTCNISTAAIIFVLAATMRFGAI